MERVNSTDEEARVMAMLGDWREEDSLKEGQIDIDELLHTTSQQIRNINPSVQSQASSHSTDITQGLMVDTRTPLPDYNSIQTSQKIPMFSSSANRPSVLDLSTTVKSDMMYATNNSGVINGHSPSPHQQQQASPSPHQQLASPHSPHHSPYVNNQTVFNYNNAQHQQQDLRSPISPHPQQMHSPVSPHQRSVSPHQRSVSPHSHMQGDHNSPLSPHLPSPHNQQQRMIPTPPPLSPHGPYNRSVSPHPQHSPHQTMSPMSPHQQVPNHSGAMSPHHSGMHSGGPVSPHHMTQHAGSVSPVHRQLSPTPGASSVFGRYAGSPVSMHSGNSSDADSYYGGYSSAQLAELRKRGINLEKGSDLYKAKRERNNVAVRKSREKKKQREQETEKRVKELSEENSTLQNKLDIAIKEMNLLKNLYKNIGVQLPPEARSKLENELSKFK